MFDAFSQGTVRERHGNSKARMSKGRRVTLRKGRHFKMRRLALVVAVAMASGRADALGLGDIELHSALNEPLNAEVRLLAEHPGELKNAVVKLAPNEEFTRAGIERPAILSDLNFTIVTAKDGASVVKITSTQPVREPFLDFVVQMSWQSGRLLREYTVLLDPPVFGEEKAAPVAAPEMASSPAPQPMPQPEPASVPETSQSTTPAKAETSVPSTRPAPAPREARRHMESSAPAPVAGKVTKSPTTGAKTYGLTQRTDTLWNIANTLRPDDSVSVYQMMMALLKANPQAFYNHNVNGLMAGYVLRVPEKSVVAAVDEAEAVREAARQYEQWQRSKQGVTTPAESGKATPSTIEQTPGAHTADGAQDQEKETARLRLVAPGNAAASSAGGVQAEIDKLRGDLAIALESSDSTKRESEELRSRVTALEEQISSLQRLLTLKDQALSDMQKRSGIAVPPTAQAPAPATTVTPNEPPKPIVKPGPAKPAPKAAEKPSLDLSANPALIGAAAGAALLLLSVVWLIVRRRRSSAADEAEDTEQPEPVSAETAMPAINIQFADEEQTEAPAMEGANDARMNQVAEEVAQHAEQDMSQTTSDLDVLHTPEGDIDPIVEADVYLAYRRYQQAEALVQGALARQPNRQDLQAKLLEIYYAAKNAGAFQTLAQTLFANLASNPDDPLWQRIVPMGRELCPDHELFAAPADSHDEQSVTSARDTLFNQDSDLSAGQAFAGDASDGAQESYDLNLGMAGASAAPQEEKMDFDLNLGGETAVLEETQQSSASLGESLDMAGASTAMADKAKAAVPAESESAQDKTQNSWEIDSALSDYGNIDFGLDDSDLLAGTDVVGTKLDLARAYIDMGDNESATEILKEVAEEGNEQQKQEAKTLMEKMA
jgi:pilus assembly protein FimV